MTENVTTAPAMQAPLKPLTYLALPYTYKHKDPKVSRSIQEIRFLQSTKAAAWLMNKYDWNVFAPITHSHPLHVHANMRGDWEFWKRVDTEYLQVSCRIIVLGLDGWRKSVGVQAEIKIAKEFGIPRYFLEPISEDGEPFRLHTDTTFFNNL